MNVKNVLWGIFLIVIGLIVGFNTLGVTNIDLFFDGWWTLFIIVPCFIGLFTEKSKTGNIIGLLIGIFLLLSAQNIISFELVFKMIIPVVLVILGISIVFKNTIKQEKVPKVKNELEYISTFTYQNINLEKEEFKGCNVDSIFGGLKLSLSGCKLEDKSVINCNSIFGGIEIIVPKDTKVVVKSTSIFGGISNRCKNTENYKKTLYINGTCLFGGIDIYDKDTKVD